jgi:penicillin G amidase
MRGELILLGLACGLVGCMPAWRASLPATSGEVAVAGLDVEVEILWDRWGVPHVRSESDRGAVFGLGWCHAQDRLWQMEVNRRIGSGRLSEIFGKRAIEADRYLRTMGFRARAEEAAAQLDPEWQWLLDAYFDGVNAYLATDPPLPPELSLLRIEPEPFGAADGLTWIKIMAMGLGSDAYEEELRAVLRRDLDPALVDELLAPFPDEVYRDAWLVGIPEGDGESSTQAGWHGQRAAHGRTRQGQRVAPGTQSAGAGPIPEFLQELLMLAEPGTEAARGSNNWVVAADHTTTGAPLLANDPHLDFQMPSLWYLAHLEGERLHVTGPTFPGLPGFPIGHNEQLAWGLTNVGPDVQDLVVEHFDPADPLRVEYAGAFEPVTVRDELIRVKGGKDVELRVRETRHGPIVTEYYDGVGEEVALRWTALADDDATVVAFSELVYATTVDEGMEAMRSYVAPAQNIVLADRDGHIGWLAAGRYPLRSDGGDGNLPVPGWDGAHEWTGWLPFEEWPRAVDPEQGWIATANAKTVGPGYPHYLGDDYSSPYRTQRIVDRLSVALPVDGAAMAAIQRDVVSLLAVELLPTLRGAAERAGLAAVVDGWDGSMDADSAAAALFQAWLIHLPGALVEGELGEHADKARGLNSSLLHRCFVADGCSFCGDGADLTCDETADLALTRARELLAERLGPDPAAWRWGRLHDSVFHHRLGGVPGLGRLLDRTVHVGGSPFTVAAAFYSSRRPFETRFGVSYRQVLDLSDWDASRVMHTTGQSGHPASPHYDDLLPRWSGGQLIPMPFSAEAVDEVVRDRMVLLPAP